MIKAYLKSARKKENSLLALPKAAAGWHWLVNLIFPIQCLGCSLENAWMCLRCLETIPTAPHHKCAFCEAKTEFGKTCAHCLKRHHLDGALSFIPYAQPLIQAMLHSWKYNGVSQITPYLTRLVLHGIQKSKNINRQRAARFLDEAMPRQTLSRMPAMPPLLYNEHTLLAPIPLHKKKLKQRGFNQAALLAKSISQYLNNALYAPLLGRHKKTVAQAGLHGIDRVTNMWDAFSLTKNFDIKGRHIIIVDDVITTGSTCDAAAKILKDAGALSVWALTIAYGHAVIAPNKN